MKRQKVDDGAVVPVLVPAVDVNWLPGVTRKKISRFESDYERYCAVNNYGRSLPDNVPDDVFDYLEVIFAQEEL